MNNSEFISNINNLIENSNYVNGELKVGTLINNFFDFNINNYNKFYNFISSKYKKTTSETKIYYYHKMFLISNNENSHICFKFNDIQLKYFTPFDKKYSLRFSNNDFNKIDVLYFPSLEKYDYEENNKIDTFEVKYKNSTIYINFVNINNKVNSINFKFNVDKNNLDNFKNNLSFILSKFYFEKHTFD